MSKKKTVWTVPDEIRDLFCEQQAMDKLRDIYVGRIFGFKKAVKCGIQAQIARTKAWNMVHKLYPETRDLVITWYSDVNELRPSA